MDGLNNLSLFWPIGGIGQGSSPLAFVGFVAFLLIVLRVISLKLVLSASDNSIKGVPMKKTSTVRIFVSSILETLWAAGVGGVVGHLSTKTNSSHNNQLHRKNLRYAPVFR
jgi:cell shape-determining protein MreC